MADLNHPSTLAKAVLALTLALLLVVGFGPLAALAAPAQAGLPPATCTNTSGNNYTCELWAKTGALSLPGSVSMPVWGYAGSAAGPAQVPGPALIVPVGAQVTLILHNTLGVASGLYIESQGMIPDRTGAAANGQKTYTFTASTPGTFLYEAGLLPNAQYQTALGLYGAFIVRPATPTQAYSGADTAFDDEALLVLSEIDPALNNSANPAAFDLRGFQPKYWLINGKAYPQTDAIPTGAGRKVLLRYVNAGLQNHTMSLLGAYQRLLSKAGSELPNKQPMVSQLLAPGQSADMLVTVSAGAPAGGKYALYDGSLVLHNNGAPGFGGMLTFLTLDGTPPGGDSQGPAVSGASVSPAASDGSSSLSLSATLSDVASGNAAIQAGEYFIDLQGANGSGTALSPQDGTFDSPGEAAAATIPASALAALGTGSHTIYLHGQDALGNWGSFNLATFTLDRQGPESKAIVLSPAVSNGSKNVAIQATGDDSQRGGSNVVSAEYFIGPPAPAGSDVGLPMDVNLQAPIVSLNTVVLSTTVSALSEGVHPVYIRSRDGLANVGDFAQADLVVDKTGPNTSGMAAIPAMSNGSSSVRINAAFSDPSVSGAQSRVAGAELFIDTLGGFASGLQMNPVDGAYDASAENGYAIIPQTQVNFLASGNHTIYVRARDAAGNWGPAQTLTLLVDRDQASVSGVTASPNPANNVTSIQLTASASDPTTNLVAAEWFRNVDPGLGRGAPMSAADGSFSSKTEGLKATININGWPTGVQTLYVRVRDAAGNWSRAAQATLTVIRPEAIFSDGFEAGSLAAWNSVTGSSRVSVTSRSALVGTQGMEIALNGSSSAYVTDTSPSSEASYHARFYFDPHSLSTGRSAHTIFAGLNAASARLFRVQYQSSGGQYRVRLIVLRAGGSTTTRWVTISNNQGHAIEVDWQSSASASIRFYVDGVLQQTLSGLDTSAYLLESVQLGYSGGLTTSSSGVSYFDAFVSQRSSYVGP